MRHGMCCDFTVMNKAIVESIPGFSFLSGTKNFRRVAE